MMASASSAAAAAADEDLRQQQQQQPTLNEETRDLLADASMMYPLAELRDMARQGKLLARDGDDSDASTTVLTMPLNASAMQKVIHDHADELLEFHGERRHNAHLDILKYATTTTTTTVSGDGDLEENNITQEGEFVVFDDTDSETELVYAIKLDHARSRVIVAFRGSVTSSDFLADARAVPILVTNPLVENSGDKKLTFHKGFYDYLFRKKDGEKTKYDIIMEKVKEILDKHPGYTLFVTGHSLGGALCTICAFYAAVDPDLPKPVTCISFASPKLGTLSFRRAVQFLEDNRKLRLLRVANDQDPVTVVPRDCCMIYPHDLCCAFFVLLFTQRRVFRHVGMGLVLYKNEDPAIYHAKRKDNYFRTLLSDWAKVCARIVYWLSRIVFFPIIYFCYDGNYRANHGYPEYWKRVESAAKRLDELRLDELYDDFWKGDRTVVKTWYW